MDPYLEAHWRDVHASLIIYARDALQGVLPSALRARVEESVLLETPAGFAAHPLYPDVRVVDYRPGRVRGLATSTAADVALMEPYRVLAESDPPTETYIEIIDRESGNRVVTVLEFLSPSNKSPGPNREQYLSKQRKVCASDANLVEIDLNRFGDHTLAFLLGSLPPAAHTSYMVCVRRATQRGEAEVYALPLWSRLPSVKIPLRPDDMDVRLDLQALVEQCYRNGAYEGTLDYSVEPDPPLLGAEKTWAEERLRELGLRKGKAKGKKKPRGR